MKKEKCSAMLNAEELNIISVLYGVVSPAPTSETTHSELRMNPAEVRTLNDCALRKLRGLKLNELVVS